MLRSSCSSPVVLTTSLYSSRVLARAFGPNEHPVTTTAAVRMPMLRVSRQARRAMRGQAWGGLASASSHYNGYALEETDGLWRVDPQLPAPRHAGHHPRHGRPCRGARL